MQFTPAVITKLIWGGGILVALMVIFGAIASLSNTYVAKNNNVANSASNISVDEQRRVDLFNNLVDAVQDARNFEKETQTKIAEARSQANKGNVDQAMLTLTSVTEAYPEIKSIELYKNTMLEFSITENRLAGYRQQYNNDVREFNNFVQGFWPSIFLPMVGKDTTPKQPLDYKVNNAEARDLFKKD